MVKVWYENIQYLWCCNFLSKICSWNIFIFFTNVTNIKIARTAYFECKTNLKVNKYTLIEAIY